MNNKKKKPVFRQDFSFMEAGRVELPSEASSTSGTTGVVCVR